MVGEGGAGELMVNRPRRKEERNRRTRRRRDTGTGDNEPTKGADRFAGRRGRSGMGWRSCRVALVESRTTVDTHRLFEKRK